MMLVETVKYQKEAHTFKKQMFQIFMWKISLQSPLQTVEKTGVAKQDYNRFVGKFSHNLDSIFSNTSSII